MELGIVSVIWLLAFLTIGGWIVTALRDIGTTLHHIARTLGEREDSRRQ